MRRAGRMGAAVLLASVMLTPRASAQAPAGSGPVPLPPILGLIPYATPEAAVASPYGQKLIQRLGAHWRANADAKCVGEKNLQPVQFDELAQRVTLDVGRRLQAATLKHFDAGAAEAAFKAAAGEGAVEELRQLGADPIVKGYIDLLAAAASGDLAQSYIAMIERTIRIAGLQVRGETHPISTGNGELLREGEELDLAATRYAEANASPAMKRLDELLVKLGGAIIGAQDDKALLDVGPAKFIASISDALGSHCIAKI